MKIEKKDVVFIYEMDDLCEKIMNGEHRRKINSDGELYALNNISRVMRQYTRHRVLQKSDLSGGLFLDSFWKAILLSLDLILQKKDNEVQKQIKEAEKKNELKIEINNMEIKDLKFQNK